MSLSFSLCAAPDKANLRAYLQARNFAALEAELSAWQARYREGEIGDEEAFKPIVALTVVDSELRPAYDAWVTQYPRSYVARLARGFYLSGLGWSMRGSAYASETARSRFADMRSHFRDAMSDLDASVPLDPKPTLSYSTMIRVARGDSRFGDIAALLAQAIALDPKVYNARMSYLLGIRPEWGGSLAQMERFVAESQAFLLPHQATKLRGVLDNSIARAALEPGERLVEAGQYEAAVRLYDAALAKRESARGHAARGYAYLRMNRHGKALEDFDRALALDPDDECCGNTHSNRGYAHLAMGAIGKGLPDLEHAAEEMNDHWAARQLAGMYAYGWHGMRVDPVRARPWCERAARQGDPWSMYCLGSGYYSGWGGARDAQKAVYWLARAGDRGVAGAQYDLGWIYWTGEDVSWNPLAALQWWMRAATQGDRLAQQRLFTVAVGPALVILLLGLWGAVRHRRKSKAR